MSRELRKAFEAADKKSSGRIRVGVYAFFEDAKAERDLARAAPRKPQPPDTAPAAATPSRRQRRQR